MLFEETGAYEYLQMKKHETSTPSNSSTERTEFTLEDQEADVFIPDDDED